MNVLFGTRDFSTMSLDLFVHFATIMVTYDNIGNI